MDGTQHPTKNISNIQQRSTSHNQQATYSNNQQATTMNNNQQATTMNNNQQATTMNNNQQATTMNNNNDNNSINNSIINSINNSIDIDTISIASGPSPSTKKVCTSSPKVVIMNRNSLVFVVVGWMFTTFGKLFNLNMD